MDEVNPVVLGKYEFDFREKLELKGFSSDFSDYQDSDARENIDGFQLHTRLQVQIRRLRS